jgi:transcriptional regulator with XRE-family HTH domain
MDTRTLGDAFRVVMQETGWSGARLARELGVSQPWVSMVLSGQRDPGVGRAADLLARAGWTFQLIPSEDDPVKRRAFLLAAAGATASAAFTARTANPYRDPAYIDALTARLIYNENQMGGAPLAREAIRHAARAIPAARDDGQELQAATSRLCRQVALILHDARHSDQAEGIAGKALMLGRMAADTTAQAQAYDTLSMIAAAPSPNYVIDGRAIEYARLGLALPDTSVTDRAILAARHGRANALAGESYAARGSLEEALELAAQDSPSAETTGNIGIGFTDLGMAVKAGPYLDTAVRLSAGSPFVSSLYVSRQAKAAIRARQPEIAAGEMMTLAALAPLVQSPRVGFHIRHIIDGTEKWAAVPEVHSAREALREVAA